MARRKRYSAEFKREALRRADEPGVTDVLVAVYPGTLPARNLTVLQVRRYGIGTLSMCRGAGPPNNSRACIEMDFLLTAQGLQLDQPAK